MGRFDRAPAPPAKEVGEGSLNIRRERNFRNASIDGGKVTLRVIFDRAETSGRSCHVGGVPESGNNIMVLASAAMGLCEIGSTAARRSWV